MKAKVIVFMILIVLFTIFVSQNTEVIPIDAFFWRFEMSKIVLISLTGLVGVILGFILASMFNKPKKPEKIIQEAVKETNKDNLPRSDKVNPDV
jgi:uncharacterized integral membrane protein